jgi:dethiobiotin synthetase
MLRLFLTANDTDAGKTFVATRLIAALQRAGLKIAARKPVESGWNADDATCNDAALLASASSEPLEQVCRFRFPTPIAPIFAARIEDQALHQDALLAACQADSADLAVIEGAGGLLSPLSEEGDNADFAHALGAPVLIVVRERLGAINQARMALLSVQARGLSIAGLILNGGNTSASRSQQNAEVITQDLARYTETTSTPAVFLRLAEDADDVSAVFVSALLARLRTLAEGSA